MEIMKTTAQMESLWQYIQSLSLDESNRRWLADRLVENTAPVAQEPAAEYISKKEILAGIDAGLKEVKLTHQGKLEAKIARDFLDEL